MNRLVTIVTLAALLVGLLLLGSTDTDTSLADTSIPDNEATSSVNKASNSSASVQSLLPCILGMVSSQASRFEGDRETDGRMTWN